MDGYGTCEATKRAVMHTGTLVMTSRDLVGRGTEHGYPDMLSFYLAGRFGVLGTNVPPAVVAAAAGVFNENMLNVMWPKATGVAETLDASVLFGDAIADAGRTAFRDFDETGRLADLAMKVVSAASAVGRPLFAGWRSRPLPDDDAGRAALAIHLLREWRGGAHVAALATSGIDPHAAVLRRDGAQGGAFYGWSGKADAAVSDTDLEAAEHLTDVQCAPVFERVLDLDQRSELAYLVGEAARRVAQLPSAFATA